VSHDYWAADDEADALEDERKRRAADDFLLLEERGVTSQTDFAAVERERWNQGMQLAAYLKSGGLLEEAEAFGSCHSRETISICGSCRKVVKFWNRCDIFFCPQCAPRLAKKRLEGLMWFVEKMCQPKHMVLTMKNVDALTSGYVADAKKKLARFRRKKIFAGARSGLWAMEITNKEKGWHLHFHLVVDIPWIDVRELSREWSSTCGDGSKIVWIEDARRGTLRQNLPRYVTKYAGKGFRPQDWSAEKFCEFVSAVKGGRTFGVFGELLGVRKEWRGWLKLALAERTKCECGCDKKFFKSPLEYQWQQLINEGGGSRPPPMPESTCEAQFELPSFAV
jgi:hypothetical protein